uniref:RBR-type E3 ubiquitin transferase n=1 Tax=Romanomermis culicivorax TaxID=13658 RepID=A0A915HVZ9_ROMCU
MATTAGTATVASHPSFSGPSVSGINHPGALSRSSSIITRSISNSSSRTDKMNPSQQETCLICFTVNGPDRMTGLECGHKFCAACWTHYLSQKIMDEGMGQTISCAAFNCDILVDDATVMRLVIEPKIKARYQHLITNSFVDSNRLLRWCPSADCQFALKVQYANTRPVKCNCGLIFCFTCGHEWHDPVKCSFLKKWIKKCNDDSETSNWIAANTKVDKCF